MNIVAALLLLAATGDGIEVPRTMPPLEPDSPRPVRSFFMRKITSPVTFLVNDSEITLAGVAPPSECGKEEFDAEAERFLRSLIDGEELRLERNGATTVVHRVRDQRNVNLSMLRNGYGCAVRGTLPLLCPQMYVAHGESAREKGRGMWRAGAPLAEGYVSESAHAAALMRRQSQ
ncbi:MAG TPA: hypothetical protein VF266_07845 [Thermoanaerobaculia bacterium]